MLAKSEAVLMGGKGFIPAEGEGAAQVSHSVISLISEQRVGPISRISRRRHKGIDRGRTGMELAGTLARPSRAERHLQCGSNRRFPPRVFERPRRPAIDHKNSDSSDDASSTLSGIPDWAILSQHEYWGYRRMRHDGVVERTRSIWSSQCPVLNHDSVYRHRKEDRDSPGTWSSRKRNCRDNEAKE